MAHHHRYAETASRLARRYADSHGRLVTHINGEPTRYRILDTLAAVKYLGCDPEKFPELRHADGSWRVALPKETTPALYTTPSGLGGIFTVKILEALEGDCVRCQIHMPRNPDWHGHKFIDHRASLTPASQ